MEAVLPKKTISVNLSKNNLEVFNLAIDSFKGAVEYPMTASSDSKKYDRFKRRKKNRSI